MSDYTQTTNFTAKDALAAGDPLKIIKGSDVDTEFAAIATAIATKANSASPTLTGTVTITGATLAGNATISGANTHSGANTFSGASTFSNTVTMSGKSINYANASVAAHATTMDPWSLGNYVTLTGAAVTFTNMAAAPQAGAEVEIYMNAAHTFTDGAVFEVDGDANWTAEIGDRVLLRAKSTILFTVHPRKKNGTPITVATQAQAKVWGYATVAAGVPTLEVSYNVTSITDTAQGQLTVTIATDFSSVNYSCIPSIGVADATFQRMTNLASSFTAGSARINCMDTTAYQDPSTWGFAMFGDQ